MSPLDWLAMSDNDDAGVVCYQLASMSGPGNWLLMVKNSLGNPSGAFDCLRMVKS